jgi:cytosine/adenosine deaminase-related metal-dependent hydrolase
LTAADATAIAPAAAAALAEARAAGTIAFGDVANTTATVAVLAAAGVSARVFLELLGFNSPDPAAQVNAARATLQSALAAAPGSGRVRGSLAAHAPYSVAPGLFSAIRRDLDSHPEDVTSVHLGESPEEVELLRTGMGPWRQMLDDLGVWTDAWSIPAVSPARYLEQLGFLGSSVAAVHGVQFTADDVAALRVHDTAIIVCPRSNRHVGVGEPPLASFYDAGLRVAVGTDSLASVEDLNLFTELAEMRRLAPGIDPRRILYSATAAGARVLGLDADHGTIEAGRRAEVIAVSIPNWLEDVEEYLLTGIAPEQVSWVPFDGDWLESPSS